MKIERRTGTDERKILIGMIVDDIVCGRITERWEPDVFTSQWVGTVAEWCVDFYKEYAQAPKADIEALFESWSSKSPEEESIRLMESFLDSLNGEYEQLAETVNQDYITDLAGRHFNRVKLRRLKDGIEGDLDLGDMDAAMERVTKFDRMEIGESGVTDVLADESAILEALTNATKPLIRFKGALDAFFRDALVPDAFVALQAPEKRGKTFWLEDIAWRGMRQNKKVAFFAVGDMSRDQMMRRFITRAIKRPLKPSKIRIPIKFERPDGDFGDPIIEYKDKTFMQRPEPKKVLSSMKKLQRKLTTGESLLRLSVHPNSSISMRGIEAILDRWEREGWNADVVVIDYIDILDMPDGGKDQRDKINATWKQGRAMSQRRHCLVVTATQADAASYESETMDMTNFSEDKRKLSHVTGMFALNQTRQEKARGIYRLNWIVLRDSDFDTSRIVHVAGCLGLAAPAILSCF